MEKLALTIVHFLLQSTGAVWNVLYISLSQKHSKYIENVLFIDHILIFFLEIKSLNNIVICVAKPVNRVIRKKTANIVFGNQIGLALFIKQDFGRRAIYLILSLIAH